MLTASGNTGYNNESGTPMPQEDSVTPPTHEAGLFVDGIRPLDPTFRIGNPAASFDHRIGDTRRLGWHKNPEDDDIAPIAGWADLEQDVIEQGVSFLAVPKGTRNASSILSGLEAWEGEKVEILRSMLTYQERMRRAFGRIDASLSLSTVAVTKKDRKIFVVPPHTLSSAETEGARWLDYLLYDLNRVLVSEPNKEEIIRNFQENMTRVIT